MLAAFAFAAVNTTVPATAPADFQAGVFNTLNGTDLRAMMSVCFKQDQALADQTGAFIAAIEAKDWATVKTTVVTLEPEALADAAVCENDPKYAAVYAEYEYQQDLVKKAKNDPDWQLKALKAVRPHIAEIKADAADALNKWNAGDYYGAGQAVGKVDAIVFSPWMGNGNFLQ